MEHQPVVKKKKGISPVWILPIVAAAICGWLLYKSYTESGIEVEVFFSDASGIVPSKTQVMSMGIPLGKVIGMEPDLENRKVKVVIEMDRSTEPFLVEDLKFWLVKPEVSAKQIRGLETILSGSYIGVQRGESSIPVRVFTALDRTPPLHPETPGLHIQLRSKELRSIQEGSAIYFKNLRIGSVKTFSLEQDESILIQCFIQPEYSHLIRTGSRFYNASGITMSGTLPDIKVRLESMTALFIGGIVVSTPDILKDTSLAQSGDQFNLYEDFFAAEYGVPMKLKLASGTGINEGSTKVIYRGIEAGLVQEITINEDERRTVTAHILLDPRAEIILREQTKFWLVEPEVSISGVKNLGTLLSGPYITFEPGDGEFKDSFEILPQPPMSIPLRSGTLIRLGSTETPSSSVGAPVYYKKMRIGELLGSELTEDNKSVVTSIYIYDRYTELLSSNAVFIESGGISIKADLSGFSFQMEPLVSTFKGGIDLLLPPQTSSGDKGTHTSDKLFPLYHDFNSAAEDLPALLPEGLYIKLTTEDLGSYRVGTPILFKKIRVGQIIGYHYSRKDKLVRLSCFIEEKYRDLITSGSKFFNVSGIRVQGGISGISVETESLESIIAGGIGFLNEPGGTPITNDHQFHVFESLHAAQISDHVAITVKFENIGQLKNGADVKYRGVKIGQVERTAFDQDMSTIIATLKIEKRYEGFFRKDTKIWLSRPTIKINKIENIESLFGLSVIIEPGSGKLTREFRGLVRAPHPFFTSFKGLGLILETNQLNSLDIGSPVYYRRVKVGEVTGYDLAYNFKDVLVYITIEERYAQLIRENTKFWNASGVKVTGGVFSGISVSTQSFAALMAGGIALATPGKGEMGGRVETGYRFTLHEKPEEGWLDWSPEIFVVEEEKRRLIR
ncbi:MAG: MCE family protein [Desulfofustis sp.]|nr:MCE family protein [Desulfofustis sp.]